MNKRTAAMLVVFVALAGGAWLALRAPQKGERRGPRELPKGVQALHKDEVDEFSVVKGKEQTTLKKEGASWWVTTPVRYPADYDGGVKNALEKLADLTWEEVVSEQKERAKDLEVDEEKGVRVTAKKGGVTLADLWVGKAVGQYTMVRPASGNEIWQVKGLPRWAIDKDTKGWRDKVVTTLKHDDIQTITVDAGAKGKITIKRIAGDKSKNTAEKYEVAESTLKIDKLDDAVPQGLANAVAGLRAADFADAVKLEDAGLDKPAYTVTAKAGASTLTLLVGKAAGENFYVKTGDKPQLFLVPKWTVERLAKPPIEFRDKTMVDVRADEVTGLDISYGGVELQLERQGADWKAKKPALTVDAAKVMPIVQAFSGWKAAAFADTNAVGKPTARVTVRTKDKKATTLVIGALKDQDYPVQVAGRPEVYLVKKFAVDRVLKKPDDVKKGEPQAKKG
jgi:hypothetical protein